MIRAIIIDDEPRIRQGLAIMIRTHCPDVTLAGEADGVNSGFHEINRLQPDLVFLDVQMEDGTGFDLLEKFEKIDFHIIFVTAYQEYAIKAFKFSAIDYLLKPLDPEELVGALERLRNILETEQELRVTNLLSNLNEHRPEEKKIVLRTSEKFHFVKISEIIYCEGGGNYTTFYLEGGNKVIISKSLKEYEEILSEYSFFRPHKSFLVNMSFLTGYEKGEGGYIILSGQIKIPISYRKKEEFLKIVEGM